jgi:uncharacterized protein (DUF58 family)
MSATRASMPRVRRPRPTLRGLTLAAAGVVVLAAAAWLGRVDLLFVGLVLTILPLACMLALMLDRPFLSVVRSFSPEIVATGDEAQSTLIVRNEASRPTPPVQWREAVHAGLNAPGPAPLPWLAEHGLATRNRPDTTTLHYRIGTQHRGVYDVGPMVLCRTDPFGLAYTEYAVGGVKPLLVTPRVVPLSSGELDTATTEGTEHELLRHSIPSADELIAREYRTGDPLRRVHWRATARHDKLMVRQEEQRSNPNAWILFDTRRAAHHDRWPTRPHARNEVFEQAISLVAAVGTHLLDAGFVLNVVETGPTQFTGRVGAGRSGVLGSAAASFDLPAGDQLLLASLASVRQRENEGTDYLDILADGLRRSGKAVPVFVVLGDGGLGRVGALAALRSQCDPAVAFVLGASRGEASVQLADAGFTCVPVECDGDLTQAWYEAARLHSEAAHRG